jgi:hypothetical protein
MRRGRAVLADGALIAATWAAVLIYAWNHRVFLSQAAKLFQ